MKPTEPFGFHQNDTKAVSFKTSFIKTSKAVTVLCHPVAGGLILWERNNQAAQGCFLCAAQREGLLLGPGSALSLGRPKPGGESSCKHPCWHMIAGSRTSSSSPPPPIPISATPGGSPQTSLCLSCCSASLLKIKEAQRKEESGNGRRDQARAGNPWKAWRATTCLLAWSSSRSTDASASCPSAPPSWATATAGKASGKAVTAGPQRTIRRPPYSPGWTSVSRLS